MVEGFVFRGQDLGFWDQVLRFRGWSLGFEGQGVVSSGQGLGLRVHASRFSKLSPDRKTRDASCRASAPPWPGSNLESDKARF